MIRAKIRALWLPSIVLLFAVLSIPAAQLGGLQLMPGGLGDARLNNYFLENVYQFLLGNSDSLWQLGFFWPFPYVLGFSDNLFGASPVYILGRLLFGQPDTAFQVWFYFGYIANFWAAYFALSKLGISRLSACIGATIFAFAIPVTAHAGHAQLHYRFGVPLSLMCLVQFLEQRQWRLLSLSTAWLVWQFYCGVYIGFFSLLFLAATTLVFFYRQRRNLRAFSFEFVVDLKRDWDSLNRESRVLLAITWVVLFGLLALLFYPYLQVTHLYGVKRAWAEISTMLPRPQSYFLADASWFWGQPNAKLFASIPMRWEHQMFPGAIILLLTIAALVYGAQADTRSGRIHALMAGALGLLVIMTLNVGGFSFWFFLHRFPLASAIRVMTRIDVILLFPASYLSACFLDQIRGKGIWVTRLIVVLILPAMVIELSATTMSVSQKSEWRQRLDGTLQTVPANIPLDAVLFFATHDASDYNAYFAKELDAMWASLVRGHKTVNGYSGLFPPGDGYTEAYGKDCTTLPLRIQSYLKFSDRLDERRTYQDLIKRVVPISFVGCDSAWLVSPLELSRSEREYSAEEISKLWFFDGKITHVGNQYHIDFSLHNSGSVRIAARSALDKPLRVSWRYLGRDGSPVSDWATRKDLPADIAPGASLPMSIALDSKGVPEEGAIEISLVQENVFWAHDIGVAPLKLAIRLSKENK